MTNLRGPGGVVHDEGVRVVRERDVQRERGVAGRGQLQRVRRGRGGAQRGQRERAPDREPRRACGTNVLVSQ